MAACNGAHLHIRLSTSRLIEVVVLSAACQPVNSLCWPSVFAPAALADRRALLARIQRMHPNVQLLHMDFTAIVTMAMAGMVISLFLTWSQLAFGIFRPPNTSYHHNVPSAVTVLPWCHCTPFVYSQICLLLSPTCACRPLRFKATSKTSPRALEWWTPGLLLSPALMHVGMTPC